MVTMTESAALGAGPRADTQSFTAEDETAAIETLTRAVLYGKRDGSVTDDTPPHLSALRHILDVLRNGDYLAKRGYLSAIKHAAERISEKQIGISITPIPVIHEFDVTIWHYNKAQMVTERIKLHVTEKLIVLGTPHKGPKPRVRSRGRRS